MEKENSVAKLIKGLAIFVIIVAFIGGFVLGKETAGYRDDFNFMIFITIIASGGILSVLCWGMSEIIQLLEDIKGKM